MIRTKKMVLDNGVTLLLVPDKSKNRTYAKVLVDFGGVYKRYKVDGVIYDIIPGVAHMLEHSIIENSMYGNSSRYFSDRYVSSNGVTNWFKTSYYISTVSNFYVHLEELLNIVNLPLFDMDIDKIKGPIYEEALESVSYDSYDYTVLYNECVYGCGYVNVVGSKEDIDKISNEDLERVHKVFYKPSNQVIMISGNFDVDIVVKVIKGAYDRYNWECIDYELLDCDYSSSIMCRRKTLVKKDGFDVVTFAIKISIDKFSPIERVKAYYYLPCFLRYNFDDNSLNFKDVVDNNYSITSISFRIDKIFLDTLVINIELQTRNADWFSSMVIDTLDKRCLSCEYFSLEKKKWLISYIRNSGDVNYIFNMFVFNSLYLSYDDVIDISFFDNLNYLECMDILGRLDFSNYAVLNMVKEDF